ncbi:Uncharacterised protein [Mycobacterium tuberculosis]|nr:Uncharacterised protein [Mycobacterium tuberculosis]
MSAPVLPNPAADSSAWSKSFCWALIVRDVTTALLRNSSKSGAALA